jgi:hypothetical protein
MSNDRYDDIKPRKPGLKGLDAFGILSYDSLDRRPVLAGRPGVWVVKCIIGFDGVRQLVASGKIQVKFGHVEEPFIIPERIQCAVDVRRP